MAIAARRPVVQGPAKVAEATTGTYMKGSRTTPGSATSRKKTPTDQADQQPDAQTAPWKRSQPADPAITIVSITAGPSHLTWGMVTKHMGRTWLLKDAEEMVASC
jgi:hypothetical protein